jgi:hypothetical protein
MARGRRHSRVLRATWLRGRVQQRSRVRLLRIAIGDSWIGWRPNFARRWRVLHFSEVISITKANRYKGNSRIAYCHLAIRRADGRGIELRESELCFAAALLPSVASHPGLATDAKDRLTWASKAEPMRERVWWGARSYDPWLEGPP